MKAMRTILLTLAASAALGGVAASQDQNDHTYQKTVVASGDLWISPITRLQQDLGIPVGERMKLSGLFVDVFVPRQRSEIVSILKTQADIRSIPHYDLMPPPSINDAAARKPHLALLCLRW